MAAVRSSWSLLARVTDVAFLQAGHRLGAAGYAGSLEFRPVSRSPDYSVRAAFLRFASLRLRLTLGFS